MNSVAQTPLSCNCHLVLYADDILLFKPIDNLHDLQAFQNDLQLITDWIQQHSLNPNHQKNATTYHLPLQKNYDTLYFSEQPHPHTLL